MWGTEVSGLSDLGHLWVFFFLDVRFDLRSIITAVPKTQQHLGNLIRPLTDTTGNVS